MSQILPYQQRVIDEHAELTARLGKLKTFITWDTAKSLPATEYILLVKQCCAMEMYEGILAERIANFQGADA